MSEAAEPFEEPDRPDVPEPVQPNKDALDRAQAAFGHTQRYAELVEQEIKEVNRLRRERETKRIQYLAESVRHLGLLSSMQEAVNADYATKAEHERQLDRRREDRMDKLEDRREKSARDQRIKGWFALGWSVVVAGCGVYLALELSDRSDGATIASGIAAFGGLGGGGALGMRAVGVLTGTRAPDAKDA